MMLDYRKNVKQSRDKNGKKMRQKITISMQEELLKLTDKRRKTLNLTRSAYIKSLILKDITSENGKPYKRRLSDFMNQAED
jgi:hypothetical protein